MPREPLRTISSCDLALAPADAAIARRDLVGAASHRRGVARNVDAKRAHQPISAKQAVELLGVEPGHHLAVDHGRRRYRAQAEAINRLEGDAPIRRGVAERDAKPRFGACGKRFASGGLASLGAAQFEHMAARRLAAEVVIKGEDAMDLGARDVQRFGDHRFGGLVDVAEGLLQGVQDRQQRALKAQMLPDDLRGSFRAPWFVIWHVSTTLRATGSPVGRTQDIGTASKICVTAAESIKLIRGSIRIPDRTRSTPP